MKKLLIPIIILTTLSGIGLYLYLVSTNKSSDKVETPILSSAEAYLVKVNEVRTKAGVSPLQIDPTLNDTSKLKAEDMISKNYYAHDSPDGTKWFNFIRKFRNKDTGLGENLDKCAMNIDEDIDSWVKSPGHYETMTRPQYKFFGSYSTINPHDKCSIAVNQFST